MLRMIIADDEKIIRETIRSVVDWPALGIEIVGSCKNGIEAYDMIVDEYPDIVLTDIKMPGLSGLDLIRRIQQTDQRVEFIILSGYGEFQLAKEAMKCGVRHYLLKPCNEKELAEVVQAVAADCRHRRLFRELKSHQQMFKGLEASILHSIIMAGLAQEWDFEALTAPYEQYLDFTCTEYDLCLLQGLAAADVPACMERLGAFQQANWPSLSQHAVYVNGTLYLFFERIDEGVQAHDAFLAGLAFAGGPLEVVRTTFCGLENLMRDLIARLQMYETIYLVSDVGGLIPVVNYNTLYRNVERLIDRLQDAGQDQQRLLEELTGLVDSVRDPDFLKLLATNILLKVPEDAGQPVQLVEFLHEINGLEDIGTLQATVRARLEGLAAGLAAPTTRYKDFIEKTTAYVHENIANPQLSLRWIAESYLYMNVDYVSKQFLKETGMKFSAFLTQARIEKAKQLLLHCGEEKIYTIAEEVGCGNNPKYFSHIFKKNTGMTPTEYAKSMGGR